MPTGGNLQGSGVPHQGGASIARASRVQSACFAQVMAGGGGVVHAVTWHQYSHNGHNTSLAEFLSPGPMESLTKQLGLVTAWAARERVFKPLWLGETG